MRSPTAILLLAWFPILLAACGGDNPGDDPGDDQVAQTESSSGDGDGDSGDGDGEPGDGDGDGEPEGIAGLELLPQLAGLWSGPATMTPLGVFEPMNMDLRAADGHVLFSRADLDAENSLRFAFSIETIGGKDQLVYRNGGYFLGMLRDSRTILVERGQDSWRFCAVDGGCDYIDALWQLHSPTELTFDVKVKGAQHVLWLADRVQARTLPDPFPADESSQGNGDAPFPTMPSLRVTVSWQTPLEDPADVWVLLSAQDCPLAGFCDFSRSISGVAETGATSLVLDFEQIHAGNYKGNAILDRDRNLTESLFPGSGDAVSLPNQPITIAAEGQSTATLVTLVEL
jgi:hypothetical protein